MNPRVSIARCSNYQPGFVYDAVKKSVDLLGGVSCFIKPLSSVLVKPNVLMAEPPEIGVTTHPEVLRAVIRLLKEIGCKIFVGDSPSVWGKYIDNVEQVYKTTGVTDVCTQEGVELVKFDKKVWNKKIPYTSWLDKCDHLVNVPKFKTHGLTLLTAGVKNLFGLVPGTYKTELHKNFFQIDRFSEMLIDIYQRASPSLTIIDGVIAMEGDGPSSSGVLRNAGIIVSSSDCVAIDTVLATIMGIDPLCVPTIKEARKRKLSGTDLDSIDVLGDAISSVKGRAFKLPRTSRMVAFPEIIANIAKKLIRYYPYSDHSRCIKCAACIKACPNKIIYFRSNLIAFDYSKCIACFCCQEVCPQAAIKIKRSMLAKMIGL